MFYPKLFVRFKTELFYNSEFVMEDIQYTIKISELFYNFEFVKEDIQYTIKIS